MASATPLQDSSLRARLPYMIVAAVAFLACLAIFYLAPGRSFVRNTVGDSVVVVALYGGLRAVLPRLRPIAAAGLVFLLACTIEVLQGNVIPSLFDTSRPLVAATLGSTFDWGDIVAYFVGLVVITAADQWYARRSAGRAQPPGISPNANKTRSG